MSNQRAEANRANAKRSTGPKTPEGKERSSKNALRHGLAARLAVMPSEDPLEYQRHLESFITEYQPKGTTEAHLVQSLADTSWRLNRIVALEAKLLAVDAPPEMQVKALATLSLHSHRLSRQFERTVAQLRDLQKTRLTEENEALGDFLDISEI